MKKINTLNGFNDGILVSDKHPDLVEPITALKKYSGGILKINRKQFCEYIRFAYCCSDVFKPTLNFMIEGDVSLWRTYSKSYKNSPKFLDVLEVVCIGEQWLFQPEKGRVPLMRGGVADDWNHKMINHAAHLGHKLTLTYFEDTSDYCLRAVAPSIFKLAETMGAKIYYTGKVKDAPITGHEG